jgi:NAD(P)-dependent dehydrogenase (short-subunit alcohol dehydrogenase family)
VSCQPCNVVINVVSFLHHHKRIDILINNAGVTWGAPTLEYPLEKWDQLFNINVRGVWVLTQKIANLMKEQGGGNVINISSILAYRGTDEKIHPAVPYNSAKAAINLLTMNLAVKLAHFNIRVNAIAPGFFRTEMMSYVEKPEYAENYSEMLNQIPMRRFGEINDIKTVAVFLASDAAAYITGHVLAVDGGYLAR